MSPQLVTLILALVQEAITLEPSIAAELQTLFAKQNPTPADWESLRQSVLSRTYKSYVPASALPGSTPAAGPGNGTASPAPSNAPISQSSAIATAEKPVSDQKPADPAPAPAAAAVPAASYSHVVTT